MTPLGPSLSFAFGPQKSTRIKRVYKRTIKHSALLLLLSSYLKYSEARHLNHPILLTSIVSPRSGATSATTSNSASNNANKNNSRKIRTTISGGLINLGNTCYLNAQLECAYHIPKIREYILNDSPDGETNMGLASLRHVFRAMYAASQSGKGNLVMTPSSSTNVLCRNLGINVYEQQDSQEFWKLLLPELDHTSLTSLYKGEFENYITALDGSGRERKRNEKFLDLSVDVANFDNVNDSLEDMFTSGEVLSVNDGNGWRPEPGADKVDALKGSTILSSGLPTILQLHLMRFNYDMRTGGMSKINDRFIFQKELDLSRICKGDGKDDTTIYDLQSIVIHSGEYGSGHYYAYVRPNIQSNKWYRYDDERVEQVTFKMVKEDAFGGQVVGRNKKCSKKKVPKGFWQRIFASPQSPKSYGWGGKKSSAYMLQYVKRSEIPMLYFL